MQPWDRHRENETHGFPWESLAWPGAVTPAQAEEGLSLSLHRREGSEGFSEASVHLLEFGRLGQEPKPEEVSPSLLSRRPGVSRQGP